MGMHNSRKLQLEQATLMVLEIMIKTMGVDTGQGRNGCNKAHYRPEYRVCTYVL
jgi:hypothetical protein